MPAEQRSTRWLAGAGLIVAAIAAVKLLVHLYADRYYGYFVDELYYLACSDHLDWGYVDQPPMIAVITKFSRFVLGDSLSAIRFLPALAGTVKVVLTALLARELGGRRFAQGLAALAVLLAPGFLAIDNVLSMNAFEPLLWLGCAYVLARMINTGQPRLWLWFGLLAGIGLETKHSILIFGAGVIGGLLLTPERRHLRTPWLLAGGVLALLLFLPNLLWNVQHHFPFLELQENIRRSGRNVDLSIASFFGQEILSMLPLSAPIWIAGLWHYFAGKEGRRFRALGWAWLITTAIIVIFNRRIYYLWPAFPMLFAAGGVRCELWLAAPRWKWLRVAYPAAMIVLAIALSPLAIPVLPPEMFVRYTQAIHLDQPRVEMHRLGPLPQIFADQFGWDDMAATVARVYNGLPADIRAKTAIYGQNYGQAGAIDFFGPKYGLPKAISGHQNYFLWGPRGYTGESMIVLDDRRETLEKEFDHVEKVASVDHPYSMPYQHFDVFYCRGLKWPLREVWPKLKNWN
jgi:dolichyl-phosphate-mannose-protein mannosyltransferase